MTNYMTNYIYDDIEVIKTNRTASKQKILGRRVPTNSSPKKVEITPADESTGTWKKWVNESELYIIDEDNSN